MNDPLHAPAYNYANDGHSSIKQLRKYSGKPYIEHPTRVVKILMDAGVTDMDVLNAAYMHDLIEDVFPVNPKFSLDDIRAKFGWKVQFLVDELTDRFTHVAFPKLNRAARKQLEAERIARCSDDAIKIKLADLIDNTSDIVANDHGFAQATYLPEKRRVLELLTKRVASSNDAILKKLYQLALANV